jgi:two-component system sensor histidine kinase PilS (NtrC family)
VPPPFAGSATLSDAHWQSLRYFNLYRLVVAALLLVAAYLHPVSFELVPATDRPLYLWTALFYCVSALGSILVLNYWPYRFNLQLTVNVVLDILVITLLMQASGGLRGGLGAMLLVSLAAAGLVGQGRLVVFYAALATLAVLFQQTLLALGGDLDLSLFFQAGLLSVGFFTSAISARLLARRVVANEMLARNRGIALANQVYVSQRVIEEMQDGVLVVTPQGEVRLHNPQAEALLGLGPRLSSRLEDYSRELDIHFRRWRLGVGGEEGVLVFQVPHSGKQVLARLLETPSSEGDTLVLLEDMERLREGARQMKLAALGRLTASIAHEIRNPLSAINHAGELLRETAVPDSGDTRLVQIVLDNAQRLERIVRDVLEIGRRDRCHPEPVAFPAALESFLEEFSDKEGLAPGVVQLEPGPSLLWSFDRTHLHQVLWNLLGNALRHSRRQPGSVRLSLRSGNAGQVELHIRDDGPGVPAAIREQVFEPFFTTHNKGTGLGLYIARELCEANGARLELLDDPEAGAHFRITGRIHDGSGQK